MTGEQLLTRARGGDTEAFGELVGPYRRELHVHCYRILGSTQDAEDVLQETLLAAWRALSEFEERASVRSWLYRIATNHCLNAVRAASRRPQSYDEPPPGLLLPEATSTSEPSWLEPYPDVLLDQLPDEAPGPEARYELRESISLAFVTALQLLPARQRAVLILRDVLGFHASEVAAFLSSSEGSVTSALKRARATLERHLDRTRDAAPAVRGPEEQALIEGLMRAFEANDVDGVVSLLTDDVVVSMPPVPFEYRGVDAASAYLTSAFHRAPPSRRVIPTRANGQPAFGTYIRQEPERVYRASGLFVCTLSGDRISRLTRFEVAVLPLFGLPRTLRADE
jgi:RNA polymerase sigma-70 factor (TIGR02960 family)